MSRKLNTDEVIKQFQKVHGDKYNYSLVEYKTCQEKVKIICPIHGIFEQTPLEHKHGQSCPKCSHRSYKYSTEEWVEMAKKIHGNKYDYFKVEYINQKTKVCIICPEHGEFFTLPMHHIKGHGCPSCAGLKKYTNEEFIEKAKKVHGDKYDYSKVKYINNNTKICIICRKHGEFWQLPSHHLQGVGCPICCESKLENNVRKLLIENSIKFIQKASKNTIPWIGKQHLDFYLPDYNAAIECQGIQHFEPVCIFGGKKEFIHRKKLDAAKLEKCNSNNIKIVYINYSDNDEEIKEKIYKICNCLY